jgi:hypothetical protein
MNESENRNEALANKAMAEIEVTPEMIAAGLEAFRWFDASDMLCDGPSIIEYIFLEMYRAKSTEIGSLDR